MKRVLSFLLVVVMNIVGFSSFVNAVADEPEAVVGLDSKVTDKFDKLKAFGILEDYTLDDYIKNEAVKRGDFAVMAAVINGADVENMIVGLSPFEDITVDSKQGKAISYLKTIGAVAGMEGNKFYPERSISLYEAIKILEDIMGYQKYAESYGGHYDGYFTVAAKIGLYINVSDEEALKFVDVINLIWSALDTDLFLASEISSEGLTLQVGKNETLLSEKMKIFKKEGLVEANQYTALINKSKAGTDSVVISEQRYNDIKHIAQQYLGYLVDFYYQEDEYGDYNIVYISPANQVKTINVKDRDILYSSSNFTQFNFVYEENNREKNITLPDDVNVIYNNEQYFEFTKDTFNVTVGEVTLVSNDGGKNYTTVYIDNYETFVVDKIDVNNNYVTDKLGGYLECKIDGEADNVVWNFSASEGTDINDLKEWDVLSVKRSQSGEYLEIVVSDNFLEGTIDGIKRNEADEITLTIDGKLYKVIKDYTESSTNQYSPYLTVGKKAIFSVDFLGNIVAVDYDISDEWQYAMLRKIMWDEVEETVILKLTDIHRYKLDDKVKIDGENCKKNGDWITRVINKLQRGDLYTYQSIASEDYVYQLIRFKLDSEQNITDIDTTYKGSSEGYDSLMILSSVPDITNTLGVEQYYRSGYGMFGGVYGVSTDGTKLFYAPLQENLDINESFVVRPLSYLRSGNRYTFIPYGTSRNDITNVPLMVILGQGSSTQFSNFAVVSDQCVTLNEDNEAVARITVYCDGKESTYDSYNIQINDQINVGDIIRFKLDSINDITEVQVFYSAEEKKIVTPLSSIDSEITFNGGRELYVDDTHYLFESSNQYSGAEKRVIMTDVYTTYGTFGRFGLSSVYETSEGGNDKFNIPTSPVNVEATDILEQYGLTNFNIVVYDEETRTVKAGTFDDIKDYQSYRNACSKVFVETSYSESKNLFIFNYEI